MGSVRGCRHGAGAPGAPRSAGLIARLSWVRPSTDVAGWCLMIDDFAKAYLHSDLRDARETMLWKLEGLGEYDVRRPLTVTGTNLLGLVKHLSVWEARYFGEVFGRPFPEYVPRWDDLEQRGTDDRAARLAPAVRRPGRRPEELVPTITPLPTDGNAFRCCRRNR